MLLEGKWFKQATHNSIVSKDIKKMEDHENELSFPFPVDSLKDLNRISPLHPEYASPIAQNSYLQKVLK